MVLLLALAGCPSEKIGTPGGGTISADLCVDRAGEAFCDGALAVGCDADGGIATTEPCGPGVCDAGACVSCEVSFVVPYVDPDAGGVTVEIDPSPASVERLPRMRPVEIVGRGTVSVTGPFELVRPDATPL